MADAVELLKKRNIYCDVGDHYNIHVMIADENKTYVVEFTDNKLVAEEKTGDNQIMTNYYVNLPYMTENVAGIVKFNILKDNYDEGSTFEGMWNLLQRVKYSNCYAFNKEVEWNSEVLKQSVINNMTLEDINNFKIFFEETKKEYWYVRGNDMRNRANADFWLTT